MTLNRRQMLLTGSAAVLGVGALGRLRAEEPAAKKILFFTKSSGFQHSVITREGDRPSHAEKILTEIGKAHGFEVVASKDGRMFDPDKIGQWDAFAFYTTGDLTKAGTDGQPPMSPEGEAAFHKAIEGGKGFIGMHCATDTFGHHRGQGADDPYIRLIGGEFSGHGAQQVARLVTHDPKFPGVEAIGPELKINDEWYGLTNLADDLHVILSQDTNGMEGKDYQRPPFPETWARAQGKGRVFYTSMGHREDVWENAKYQGLLIGALRWVTGQVEADVTPNVTEATPQYKVNPA